MKPVLIMLSACLLFLTLCGLNPSWAARAVYCTNCSTRAIQAAERVTSLQKLKGMWLDYAQALEQTAQQIALVQNNIQQYADMVQNTLSLPNNMIKSAAGQLSKLGKLVNQVNQLKGDATSLSAIYKDVYPDLDELQSIVLNGRGTNDMETLWRDWNKSVDEATLSTFQLTGIQLKDMAENGDELDAHIERLLSTPEGRMAALQAANNLSAMQINELHQLRQLMATHIQATTQAQAKKDKKEQMADEMWKHAFAPNQLQADYADYE